MNEQTWIELAGAAVQILAVIGFWELLHGFRPRQKSRK